jgi:hypothetical protein
MNSIIAFFVIAVILFAVSFISKRHFGLLGLALAAGSVLSGIWGYDAGLIASGFGISSALVASSIGSSLVVLLPALVLLFYGEKHKTLTVRIIGSGLFTLLALAFLIDPLSKVMTIQGLGANAYNWLIDNRSMIIGIGLIVAIIDLLLTRPTRSPNKYHKH